jgi:RNA polymerase sigma factor (sigma-70 family)
MDSAETNLKLLILRAKRDENGAFHELYTLLVDRVFAYTRSRLGSHEDALDATQQVFIELWKALPRFTYQGDPQFYAFLFLIVKRQIIRVFKERQKAPEALIDEKDLPDTPKSAGEDVGLQTALATLSDLDRDIIILHHWSRYTFGEIGAMLTLTEASVRVRHHRALKVLREVLEPHI